MKWYSEKLNKLFDSEKECVEAEEAHDKAVAEAEEKKKALSEARAARAKEVEAAYKAAIDARKEYEEVLHSFVKDYGSYHTTFKSSDPFFSLFGWL